MKALEEEERAQKENTEAKEAAPLEEKFVAPANNYQYQHQSVQAPQFQKPLNQFVPTKYVPPMQNQQRIPQQPHVYKPYSSANTVPSKSFQMLERKYSVDSDAGSDSLKNSHGNEDNLNRSK